MLGKNASKEDGSEVGGCRYRPELRGTAGDFAASIPVPRTCMQSLVVDPFDFAACVGPRRIPARVAARLQTGWAAGR